MDQAIAALDRVLDFINTPAIKTVMLMAFAWGWNLHRDTLNKAIPFLTGAASFATSLAGILTNLATVAAPPDASPAFYAAAAVGGGQGGFMAGATTVLLGTVVPVFVTVGAHSWSKNLREWILAGCRLYVDRHRVGG